MPGLRPRAGARGNRCRRAAGCEIGRCASAARRRSRSELARFHGGREIAGDELQHREIPQIALRIVFLIHRQDALGEIPHDRRHRRIGDAGGRMESRSCARRPRRRSNQQQQCTVTSGLHSRPICCGVADIGRPRLSRMSAHGRLHQMQNRVNSGSRACAARPMWMTLVCSSSCANTSMTRSMRLIIERSERVVDQQPRRALQRDAREGQPELLVLAQLPIPAAGHIQHGHEALQSEPLEDVRKRRIGETCRPSSG